ncbi:MAG: hypothetical protein JSV42_16960 [Chloroflexota bacterium]|nr:MAG: hypothetical protein JSV42_16960 [Chloroflexota bacterium]
MKHDDDLVHLLIARLERLSADSYWAHQASGVRGSLLRMIDSGELHPEQREKLIRSGFDFLEKAAREK